MLPEGKEPQSSVRIEGSDGVEAQLHAVVNKSPNFSKSPLSHLPSVGPHLAEGRTDDVMHLTCQHKAGAQPATPTLTGT